MMASKALLKTAIGVALQATGADRLVGALSGVRRRPLVIGYHRVVDRVLPERRSTMPGMVVSARMLERQLDWIGRRYRFVSLDELGADLESTEDWTEPVAAVTFDDGYRDVYEHALPLLARKGIPAAVFAVADWIGSGALLTHDRLYMGLARRWPRSWERLSAHSIIHVNGTRVTSPFEAMRYLVATQSQDALALAAAALEADEGPPGDDIDDVDDVAALQPMSWDMLATLVQRGFTVGSHTRSHAVLTRENPPRRADELVTSRRTLEARLGTKVEHVAYPVGAFDTHTVTSARLAGYRFGYTACRHQSLAHPLLTIPRRVLSEDAAIDANGTFSAALMSCRVNGLFDLAAECGPLHEYPAALAVG